VQTPCNFKAASRQLAPASHLPPTKQSHLNRTYLAPTSHLNPTKQSHHQANYDPLVNILTAATSGVDGNDGRWLAVDGEPPRNTMQHHATPCNAMQRHATPCNGNDGRWFAVDGEPHVQQR
jgi:hypothetical protein